MLRVCWMLAPMSKLVTLRGKSLLLALRQSTGTLMLSSCCFPQRSAKWVHSRSLRHAEPTSRGRAQRSHTYCSASSCGGRVFAMKVAAVACRAGRVGRVGRAGRAHSNHSSCIKSIYVMDNRDERPESPPVNPRFNLFRTFLSEPATS